MTISESMEIADDANIMILCGDDEYYEIQSS